MAINKIERRQRIRYRIRKVVNGTSEQPRMSVFRSNKQIYVQFIDDVNGVTIVSASSKDKSLIEDVKGKGKAGTDGKAVNAHAFRRYFSS